LVANVIILDLTM